MSLCKPFDRLFVRKCEECRRILIKAFILTLLCAGMVVVFAFALIGGFSYGPASEATCNFSTDRAPYRSSRDMNAAPWRLLQWQRGHDSDLNLGTCLAHRSLCFCHGCGCGLNVRATGNFNQAASSLCRQRSQHSDNQGLYKTLCCQNDPFTFTSLVQVERRAWLMQSANLPPWDHTLISFERGADYSECSINAGLSRMATKPYKARRNRENSASGT
jgi:hypothetical protein